MIARRLVSTLLLASFAPFALGVGGCGTTGQNAASQVLKKPELPADGEAKCSVRKSQSEPLIVEWPNAARGRLEATTKRGLIPIKYEGCELTQLTSCSVKTSIGPYAYWPITRKQSRVTIKDADDLYATMPVGAVKLEGKLKSSGELDVNMTIVGRYEAPTHTIFRNDLEGDCDQVTHIIAAVTVGSFTFTSGADAEVGGEAKLGPAGAGARSTAKRETLQSDGDEAACGRASATDKGPPEGCGALLQIEVMTLTKGSRPPPAPPVVVAPPVPATASIAQDPAPAPPPTTMPKKPPKCKKGERVEDGACVKIAKKPPKGAPIASATPTCTSGQRLVNKRCVDDPPPSVAEEPVAPIQPSEPPPPVCGSNERLDGSMCVAIVQPRPEPTRPSIYDAPKVTDQEAPNPLKTVFLYSAIGFGILAAGAGSVALGAAGDSASECGASGNAHTCSPDAIDKRHTAVTLGIVSDVSLGLTLASLIGYFLVPSQIKVGAAATPHGGVASIGWRFR